VGVATVAVMSSTDDTAYQHPAADAVDVIGAGLDALSEASLWSMSTAEVGPTYRAAPLPTVDGVPDTRLPERRYADALMQLCQLATPTVPHVRGERPHMFVTTTLESLQRKAGSALGSLEGGYLISKAAVRRIACDANVIPVVLGSAGQPLDLGRSTRLVPQGLRRALIVRDEGCAFPGCDRPPLWCDAHHIDHWADGGPTSLCNTALLCVHHHDRVHRDGWTITMIDDLPWFIPPAWLDAHQRPRQNSRYRVRQLDP
jgi:uncharacterized protein DUF222